MFATSALVLSVLMTAAEKSKVSWFSRSNEGTEEQMDGRRLEIVELIAARSDNS